MITWRKQISLAHIGPSIALAQEHRMVLYGPQGSGVTTVAKAASSGRQVCFPALEEELSEAYFPMQAAVERAFGQNKVMVRPVAELIMLPRYGPCTNAIFSESARHAEIMKEVEAALGQRYTALEEVLE